MEKIKNEIIIIDSNVLLYCELYKCKLEIRKLLRSLADNGNILSISEISGFEVLKNSDNKNRDYFFQLLNYLKNIKVTKDTLWMAILLFEAYRKNRGDFCQKVSSTDYMIGSTALIRKAFLLTANRKHFPKEIWSLVGREHFVYEVGEKHEILNLFLLRADDTKIDEASKAIVGR